MKKSISFLLCGALLMTGLYCKKDSSGTKAYTNEETAFKMARDSDFVEFYHGVINYNAKVGAAAQVTRFASLATDPREFKLETRSYFDDQVVKFPPESQSEILGRSGVLLKRYDLAGKNEMEISEILRMAVDKLDPISNGASASSRVTGRCWDRLIQRESRCDRDMALGSMETVLLGTVGTLTATGVGVPLAAGVMGFTLIMKYVKHSNCISDALKDYKDCTAVE